MMAILTHVRWYVIVVLYIMRFMCCAVLSLSVMSDSATSGTVAHQASLSMGIIQARILEWVAFPFSRGSSQPRDRTQVSHIAGRFFTVWVNHHMLCSNTKLIQRYITRWSTPKSDWLYSSRPKMEKLYTVNKNKTRSWQWLRSQTPYYQIQTQIEENRENS